MAVTLFPPVPGSNPVGPPPGCDWTVPGASCTLAGHGPAPRPVHDRRRARRRGPVVVRGPGADGGAHAHPGRALADEVATMTPSAQAAGGRRVTRWSREQIVEKILEWEARYGEPPCSADWNPSLARWRAQDWRAERYRVGLWPSTNAAKRPFGGSFDAAIRAAGLEPHRPGPRRAAGAARPDVAQRDPAPPRAVHDALLGAARGCSRRGPRRGRRAPRGAGRSRHRRGAPPCAAGGRRRGPRPPHSRPRARRRARALRGSPTGRPRTSPPTPTPGCAPRTARPRPPRATPPPRGPPPAGPSCGPPTRRRARTPPRGSRRPRGPSSPRRATGRRGGRPAPPRSAPPRPSAAPASWPRWSAASPAG